jgi:hypothetical protein
VEQQPIDPEHSESELFQTNVRIPELQSTTSDAAAERESNGLDILTESRNPAQTQATKVGRVRMRTLASSPKVRGVLGLMAIPSLAGSKPLGIRFQSHDHTFLSCPLRDRSQIHDNNKSFGINDLEQEMSQCFESNKAIRKARRDR